MGDTVIMRAAAHFSEFTAGFNGTCTQTALAICMGISENKPATQESMVAVTNDMLTRKLCAQNGAATVHAVAEEARIMGYPVELEWDLGQLGDWHSKLQEYAGKLPILLQVANGQALKDVETGKADESGVHYHALSVVGYSDNGYVCADGDNPEVTDRYQIYPYNTLLAAQPCGMLVLGLKVPLDPIPSPLPVGAKDENGVITWGGFEIKEPFRSYVMKQGFTLGLPVNNLWMDNSGESYQTFTYGELRHNDHDGVFLANIGANLIKSRADIDALSKIIEKIRADLS